MSKKESTRTIRLHCPSLCKTIPFQAREEQRLDLGSIARAFGLEPWSLRLNGHFISRGVDLISSSVTWRSLLRFFSSKGLATGKDGGEPLIVDGKLLRVGSKRTQDPEGSSANCNGRGNFEGDVMNLPNFKKLKCQGSDNWSFPLLKRKHLLEKVNAELPKRLKINQCNFDHGKGSNGRLCEIPSRQLLCRYISENAKRRREDDAIAAASAKRVR